MRLLLPSTLFQSYAQYQISYIFWRFPPSPVVQILCCKKIETDVLGGKKKTVQDRKITINNIENQLIAKEWDLENGPLERYNCTEILKTKWQIV